MRWMKMWPTAAVIGIALMALIGLPPSAEAQRAAVGPPDWPCVQRLIPNLAPSAIWNGPPIDELEVDWWSDAEVGRVARFASARATRVDDAVERVRDFTKAAEGDREYRFTLLFAGLFELISRERTRTIEAIRRYSRGQVRRLERIGGLVDELEAARTGEQADETRAAEIEQEIFWERRVFEDRQASMRVLCEQPYRLEERLSRLVRAIQAEM
jgi:hypothetical protein